MDERPFDPQRYGQLLADARPAVIDSAEEHDRLLSIAEELMEKGKSISPEEEKLLELLVFLIKDFESTVEAEEREEAEEEKAPTILPAAHETLQRLMEARGLEPSDIADIFGNPYNAREVLAGRRPISRGQAKQLGAFFQVPPKLFLS
jgi:Predicted transcription regulator containing HTH domain